MTVIAFDGQTLAADKRATSGGGIARTVTKIMRSPAGELLAVTGDWDVAMLIRAWFIAGAKPAEFPSEARGEDGAILIVIDSSGIRTYGTGPYPLIIENTKAAFGSGRDYAEAAMYFGHDAVAAVQVASHFQIDCGNGIDTLVLQ
jgi:hypothetical protein